MIKLYCDRCGREIKGDVFNITIVYANDRKDESFVTSCIDDELQNLIKNERDYCERCAEEIREALEAREPESRDECDINVFEFFAEVKEICSKQEDCADCNITGICGKNIEGIKMEDVKRTMDAVKKRHKQKQAENKSV